MKAKETTANAQTTSTASNSLYFKSSSTNPAHPHKEADTCCVCLEDLQVDSSTFSRMTCCGKAVHLHCKNDFFGSSLSREQKGKCPHCPHCQVKLKSTEEEHFELTCGWADKGKAWAQADLGDRYSLGVGVHQSYEKANEYYTLAIYMYNKAIQMRCLIWLAGTAKNAIDMYTNVQRNNIYSYFILFLYGYRVNHLCVFTFLLLHSVSHFFKCTFTSFIWIHS